MTLLDYLRRLLLPTATGPPADVRITDPFKRRSGKRRWGSKPPPPSNRLLRSERKRQRQARKFQRRRARLSCK
jgi:hypothetical protein